MAVFLCLEKLLELLPAIARRVQLFGKRHIWFDREPDGKFVANIANAGAISQNRQPESRLIPSNNDINITGTIQ